MANISELFRGVQNPKPSFCKTNLNLIIDAKAIPQMRANMHGRTAGTHVFGVVESVPGPNGTAVGRLLFQPRKPQKTRKD